MPTERKFATIVVIKSIDRGGRLACDRLHTWLETFGHTSVSHGFEFVSTSPITGKLVMSKKEKK